MINHDLTDTVSQAAARASSVDSRSQTPKYNPFSIAGTGENDTWKDVRMSQGRRQVFVRDLELFTAVEASLFDSQLLA